MNKAVRKATTMSCFSDRLFSLAAGAGAGGRPLSVGLAAMAAVGAAPFELVGLGCFGSLGIAFVSSPTLLFYPKTQGFSRTISRWVQVKADLTLLAPAHSALEGADTTLRRYAAPLRNELPIGTGGHL